MRISNAASSSESSDTSGSSASSSQGSDSESLQQSGSETEEYSDTSGPSRPPRRRAVSFENRKSRQQMIHADESSQHSVDSSRGQGKNSRYSTRNQGRRTVRYQEDSDLERGDAFLDHDQSDLDGDQLINVSSRGRIRKPNLRVRTSL